MYLKTLYLRFYKSFNYDYLRKSNPESTPDLWDTVESESDRAEDGMSGTPLFYPFVRIPLDAGITTVVGSNEAGKSQLLSAIKCLLTGDDIQRSDFCRYSRFFAVDRALAVPEFGGEFGDLSKKEADAVREVAGLSAGSEPISSFRFFRRNDGLRIYVNGQVAETTEAEVDELGLPQPFTIDSQTPLPNSVPVEFLAGVSETGRASWPTRARWRRWMKAAWENATAFADDETVKKNAPILVSKLGSTAVSDDEMETFRRQLDLAESLLITVGGIDRSAFEEIRDVVEAEGYANGLVDKINKQLSDSLNFPRWWSQDKEFALTLTLRDFDLVFTVRDRTHSDYSFSERSGGMSYFLSYFVQYLSHQPSGGREILLMDEPDAFLSTQGQQDLLKIFDAFASPDEPGRQAVQVVYVTHSPFLIDKNHSERIRVLQKGENDEGTRVVADTARNHYEPLRSAFGAYVAETTFIGNCNLIVEGQADQVLLAGVSVKSRRLSATLDALDLNQLTIVPAGGSEHVPYMVYLARGRDIEKPAVVALLDGDSAGQQARNELKRGYRKRTLIRDEYVICISDIADHTPWRPKPTDVEDLVHPEVAKRAVQLFAREVLPPEQVERIVMDKRPVDPAPEETIYEAAQRFATEASEDPERALRLQKVGFARAVVAALDDPETPGDAIEATVSAFRALFEALNRASTKAVRAEQQRSLKSQVKDRKTSFLRDHPHGATRRQADELADTLDDLIRGDHTIEGDTLRDGLSRLRDSYKLRDEPGSPVNDWEQFKADLDNIAYAGLRAVQQDSATPSDSTEPEVKEGRRPRKSSTQSPSK